MLLTSLGVKYVPVPDSVNSYAPYELSNNKRNDSFTGILTLTLILNFHELQIWAPCCHASLAQN